jgi:hypothetical protein
MRIFLILLLFTGCKVTKDNKAIARVLSSTELSDKAYSILVKQHPVTIDTVFKTINGKPVVVYDTIEKPTFYTDTVIDLQPAKIKTIERLITRFSTVNDTFVKIVTDNRLLQALGTQNTVLQTQLQTSKDSDALHKKKLIYWTIAACISFLLFILMIVLLLKRK